MRAWVAQPPDTHICGQIALAVITGMSLLDAIQLVGHEKGTKTREIVRALRGLGYTCPDRLGRAKEPPDLGLGALRRLTGRGDWHWVVFDGPFVWDGAYGKADGTVEWPEHMRIFSYLPIT